MLGYNTPIVDVLVALSQETDSNLRDSKTLR